MLNQKHILMCFGVLALIIPLYWAKTKADSKFEHMRELSIEVEKAEKAVHALEAELAYLERYDRVEQSGVELGMVPQKPVAIKTLSELDQIAPIIDENTNILSADSARTKTSVKQNNQENHKIEKKVANNE